MEGGRRTVPARLGRGFGLAGVLVTIVACPLAHAQDAVFRHLSVEQGLSHGAVRAIIQDQQGFMWFATEDGLNRYDGVGVTVFRHEPGNPNSLSSSNFGKLISDRSGIMWYGTWGGGLNRYDPTTGEFTHFRSEPMDSTTLSQDRTEVLLEDRYGAIWVGTPDRGLNWFHQDTELFTRFRHDPSDPGSLASDAVKALWEDDEGRLWVGTDGGLDVLDRLTNTFTHFRHDPADRRSLSSDLVRTIARDTSGLLWIGTRGGGLNLFDPETGRARHFRHDPSDATSLSDDEIARVFVDSRGTLWLGTYDQGIDRFDPVTQTFEHFSHDLRDPNSLSNNRVEAIFEDRAHVLWFGTVGGGVDRLNLKPRKFTSYWHDPRDPSSLPHPTVRSIAAAEDGAVWFGTDGGGLGLLGAGGKVVRQFRHRPNANSIPGNRVWSLLAAGPDSLWIGTYGAGLGLMVIRGGTAVFTHFPAVVGDPTKLQDPEVKALARDHRGGLWVATTNGLYQMFGPLERPTFKRWGHDPTDSATISGDYVNSLYVDGTGILWVGTLHGLDALDPATGSIRHFQADPGDSLALGAPIITTILESLAYPGTLWIGAEDGGLHRLDPAVGVVAHYLVEDGLPSNVISGLAEDDHGRLWLSTSQGLSRFDPTTETFTNYGARDGIRSLSFMSNATATASDGRIFFGAIEGMTSLLPDSVLSNPFVPPVVLTSFKVFNEEFDLDVPLQSLERIVLPYDKNFVSIEFAALDYSVPEKNQYLYRLFGVDPDWMESGARRFANYPALDPGRYTFYVRGSNNDGVWNHTGATIKIVVQPPWWATWWFRVLATVVIAVTVMRVYRARTGRIQRRTRQLESMNASLSDQIARRRQAEEEREKLIPELEARNKELERFTYTVSHDLKSPLVTITGFLGLLEQDLAQKDTVRITRDVEQIRTAADTMQQLLEELLDLSRAGRLVNPPTAVDLGDLVQEALVLVEGQSSARGVAIKVQRGLPVVNVDRVRMLQVLQNLIQNAIEFMGDQPDPRVEIGAHQRASEYLVWVRDNGIGIESVYWDRIFVLFNQLDPAHGGTGIGLALVKRIVEVHGGEVWLESEGPGKGTTFYFSLPMAIRHPGEASAAKVSGPATSTTATPADS